MEQEKFVKGATKYGDFYLYYPKADGKTTYLVGTTDLNLPYIKGRIGNKLEAVEDGYTRVWSWTSNKLRKLKISEVIAISSLNKELNKCQKRRLKRKKT